MKEGRYICKVDQLRPLTVHIVCFRLTRLVVMESMRKYAGNMMLSGQAGMVGCASRVVWVDGKLGAAVSRNGTDGTLPIDFKGAFASLRHSSFLRLMRH